MAELRMACKKALAIAWIVILFPSGWAFASDATAALTTADPTLTLVRTGRGTGNVSSSPAGISCGSTCSASFALGTKVALTPQPSADSVFTGWSGACTGRGSCVVNLVGPRIVTANFKLKPFNVATTGVTAGVITTPIAKVSNTISFNSADVGKDGAVFVTAVVPASAVLTLLSESWENTIDNDGIWVSFGSPAPRVATTISNRRYVLDSNGNSADSSGVVLAEPLDLSQGAMIEVDVFIDLKGLSGCWAGPSFGLTQSNLSDVNVPAPVLGGFYWSIEAGGSACLAVPPDRRGTAWFSFGVLSADGTWEISNLMIDANAYEAGWHRARVTIGPNGRASFSINRRLLWTPRKAIDLAYLRASKLVIGRRASNSNAKAYHDTIWVVSFVGSASAPTSGRSTGVMAASSQAQTVTDSQTQTTLMLTESGWQTYTEGQLLPYASGVLGDAIATQNILNNVDTGNLAGAQICVGYGTSATEMIDNSRMQVIATVDSSSSSAVSMNCLVSDSLALGTGWNLLGHGRSQSFSVSALYGDAGWVNSVWKWDASQQRWQFYTPALDFSALQSYASSKGYGVLSDILPGDGYWVRVAEPGSVLVQPGDTVSLDATQLAPGWSLVSTEVATTPAAISTIMGTALTSLWAWDNAQQTYYFYAPSLDALGGSALSSYSNSQGWLDFNTAGKGLGTGVGFWVKRP
ncbi:MAG: hypothetical protein KBF66_15870 [Rhodoferax sp.]|uniref:InlB B-repeat-containing protein n=1 Tax=Rhodoferax sp. TaxID=50421 RepID=UPI001B756BD3|nr:hypothetical protein [Rhodoferax sp.]MBP9907028.1 hypothetical protein [Rhodoferax sp.]